MTTNTKPTLPMVLSIEDHIDYGPGLLAEWGGNKVRFQPVLGFGQMRASEGPLAAVNSHAAQSARIAELEAALTLLCDRLDYLATTKAGIEQRAQTERERVVARALLADKESA